MNFVTNLSKSENVTNTKYDNIMMIVNKLTKMSHYVSTRKIMKTLDLTNLFLDRVMRYHDVSNDIISDRENVFISKF